MLVQRVVAIVTQIALVGLLIYQIQFGTSKAVIALLAIQIVHQVYRTETMVKLAIISRLALIGYSLLLYSSNFY
jgi:hypothetical protein